MGVYYVKCVECGNLFPWFSGNPIQICDGCAKQNPASNASYSWEEKPNGRMATAFPICWTWHNEPMIVSNGHIDLSVIITSKTELNGGGDKCE